MTIHVNRAGQACTDQEADICAEYGLTLEELRVLKALHQARKNAALLFPPNDSVFFESDIVMDAPLVGALV